MVLPRTREDAPAVRASDHLLEVQVVGQRPNPRSRCRVMPLVVRYTLLRTTRWHGSQAPGGLDVTEVSERLDRNDCPIGGAIQCSGFRDLVTTADPR